MTRIHFEQNKFHVVKDDSKKGLFSIRGIVSVNGEINFACLGGICKEVKGELSYKDLYKQFPIEASATTGFALDGDALWIGTEMSGLFKFDTQSKDVAHFPFAENKKSFLWQPFVDSTGQVWVGSVGLYKLDVEKEVIYAFTNGDLGQLGESIIYSFHDSKDGIYLCTNNGLYLVDLKTKKILRHYSQAASNDSFLPLDGCVHLHQDKNNLVWIATKGSGLVKWNPDTGEYQSFTTTNSELTHDFLYAVYEDDFNNLWLPSHYGLMKFNKITYEVNTYYKTDGLAHNEFNTTSHFQDENGNLSFGTLNGLVQLKPSHFDNNDEPNPILLTNALRLNNEFESIDILEEFNGGHSLKITSSDRYVELDFAIANFNKKSPDKFSYKIVGLQDEWVYSDVGLVRLEALPYGTYSLEMRGKPSHTSKWSTYEHAISIVLKKPIYLQWWFLLLILFLLGFLFYSAVRWNTHKILKRQKELEQVVSKRTEEIRFQAEELKVLDRVKNDFFANISHELRTPLTLILGPLSYLIDNPEKMNTKEVQNQLLVMQRNGTNLLYIIEEILDLSKLQGNKLVLNEELLNVEEFFKYIFNKFEPHFNNMGIQATFNNTLESNFSILMDRNKMEKVLNNFLSNAIKYTPREGTIVLTLQQQMDRLLIKVEDSGSGINEADMPYIFDRFFLSNQADKKRHGGTGIGLALVKEFATLMNAEVFAESKIGEGSKFTFDLPIKKKNVLVEPLLTKEEEAAFTEENIVLNNDSFTILVAEDNEDMRDFICGLLSTKFNTVIPASNGAIAWQILQEKQTKIHLVVSDIMMPEMDGLELVKKAKENKNLSTIPFMMLTALAGERDKLAALTIGVDDYLTKPFSVPELLARINNMLVNASMRKAWWANQEVPVKSSKVTESLNEEIHLSEKDKQFIEELKLYIESNPPKEELDLNALAKRFLLSLRHLNRKVKGITGLPPAKFVREVQLQKARRILEDGDFVSISEVAYSVGFYQPSTFTSLFKKRFGTVPSKYRNKKDAKLISSSEKPNGL